MQFSVSNSLKLVQGFIFIAAMSVAAACRAQPLTLLPETVVTASRFSQMQKDLPVGITVISAEEIRNSTAGTIPDLLRQMPGIQVRDNAGSPNQQVDMRGFGIAGDQNTLVLLDGQRISENEQTTVNWSAIPLSSIARIEIMRGSGAVLYGGGATGGTINIITKAPQKNSKSGYVGLGVGSYNTGDYRAGLNLAGENLGLIVNASQLETDNYRDANRLRLQNAQAALRYTGERGTVYAKFGGNDQRLRLPNALTEAQIAVNRRQAAAPFGSYTNLSGGYLSLGGDFRLGDAEFALDGRYRGKQSNAALFLTIKNTVTVKTLTPRVKIPFALAGTNHSIVAGVDWENWEADAIVLPTGFSALARPLSIQQDRAVYIQDNIALSEATVLTGGVRFHRTKFGTTDIAQGTSGSRERDLRAYEVSLRHRILEPVAVYGKFGNSFRVPNVDDMFGYTTGTVTLLEPQTSQDREIGTEIAYGRSSFRLAAYSMEIRNEIHFDPSTFANVNLSPTYRRGLELEGKWQLADNLAMFANYTHAIAKFREGSFVNNEVPLVPRNAIKLGATWEFMPRTRLNALATYTGEQRFDGDEANTFARKMPSYVLVDLKLSHETGGWLLGAGVRNLLNEKYISYGNFTTFAPTTFTGYPQPERTFFASAQYSFK
jgi:iron complex outermembrane receptor protein